MKKSLFFAIVGFVAAVCLPVSSATANQRPITVPDAGFDDHVLADGGYIDIADAGYAGPWESHSGDAWIDYGYWRAQGWTEDLYARSGNNKAYPYEDYIYQILDETFIEGVTYTFRVWVGQPWAGYASGWWLYFTGEDYTENLIEASGTAGRSWEQIGLVYTATADDAGKEIGIKMWSNEEVSFDDVTLSYDYDPTMARNASPADGATDVPRDVVLSWTPGEFAAPTNGHKVYFGQSFNDVNDAAGSVAQTANSYTPPQRLDFGTTYYWRVDEVNAPPTSHIEFKGNVWSFTTEPEGYPIDGNNITATASSSDAGQGPENTVNRSGLDANDLHSTEMTDMWLSKAADAGEAWIQYEFDKVYKLHQMWVWNHNLVLEPTLGFGIQDATIEYSIDGANWSTLGTTHEFTRAPGAADYAHDTTIDFGGVTAKYVKVTANSNWSVMANRYGLSEVRFLYIPVWARYPNPTDGATGVGPDVVLSWRAGREAASHDVYLSGKRQAVVHGTVAAITVTEASYGPLSLELGQTYYWKINEVNMAETPTTWDGDVWSFTTPEYFVVEDFEDYNDFEPDRIFETWRGGYGYVGYCGNGTGSAVGHPAYPYAEQTIVHEGRQSMPVYYDNSATGTNSCGQPINLYYSETERTFDTPQDWTKAGVKALTLSFHGDPDNTAGAAERIYVKVNGAKVVYDGDMADIKQVGWHEWNIDLASFAGVNLQNVTKVSIGLGNGTGPGGSGVLYFDDIRLYPARCVPDRKEPPAADLNNDCKVDYKELEVMAAKWLAVAVAPSGANLVGWWKLDGNANDSAGINHGTLMGDPQWVSGGYDGGALDFDGSGDYVDIGYSPELSLNDFTVSAWVNIAAEPGLFGVLGTRVGGDQTFDLKVQATNVHGDIGDGTNWLNTSIDIESSHTGTTGQGGDLSVDTWYMITYVIDNTSHQVRLYLDADLKRTIAISGTPLLMKAGQSMRIGHTGTGSEWMNGLIDDVRIYNVVLTDVEILGLALRTDLYEDMKIDLKDFAELAAWWLDEQLWP